VDRQTHASRQRFGACSPALRPCFHLCLWVVLFGAVGQLPGAWGLGAAPRVSFARPTGSQIPRLMAHPPARDDEPLESTLPPGSTVLLAGGSWTQIIAAKMVARVGLKPAVLTTKPRAIANFLMDEPEVIEGLISTNLAYEEACKNAAAILFLPEDSFLQPHTVRKLVNACLGGQSLEKVILMSPVGASKGGSGLQGLFSGQDLQLARDIEETLNGIEKVQTHIIRHGPLRGGGGQSPGLGTDFYAMTVDDALEASNRQCDREYLGIRLARGDTLQLSPVAWLPAFVEQMGSLLSSKMTITSRFAIAGAVVAALQTKSDVPADFSVLSIPTKDAGKHDQGLERVYSHFVQLQHQWRQPASKKPSAP